MNKNILGIILGYILGGIIIGVLSMFIVLNISTHTITKINNEIVEEFYEYPDFRINVK